MKIHFVQFDITQGIPISSANISTANAVQRLWFYAILRKVKEQTKICINFLNFTSWVKYHPCLVFLHDSSAWCHWRYVFYVWISRSWKKFISAVLDALSLDTILQVYFKSLLFCDLFLNKFFLLFRYFIIHLNIMWYSSIILYVHVV